MRPPLFIFLLIVLPVCGAGPARGQLVADTVFSWRGYSSESTCRVRMYRSNQDAKRAYTIVLDELAENRGRSTLDDARHLAEVIGRTTGVDPEEAFWVFRWGAFSFPGAGASKKELYLRATFRRSDRASLGAPSWRLIDRETVEEYTDRSFK